MRAVVERELHRNDALVEVVGPAGKLHGFANAPHVLRLRRHVGAVGVVVAVVDERADDRRHFLVGEADLADVAHEVLGRQPRHPQLVGRTHDAHDVLAVHAVGHDGAALQQKVQREALLHPVGPHERDGVALLRVANDRGLLSVFGSHRGCHAFHSFLFHITPLL